MKRIIGAAIVSLVLAAGPVGAYTVVTTVAMIGDVAKEIGGEAVHVTTLIRAGVDPHLYTPTRSDVQALQQADVILYVGALLEGRMSTVLNALGRRHPHIHAVIDTVKAATPHSDLRREFGNDPHVWMDISLWQHAADGIAAAFATYDPANRARYLARLQRYRKRLAALDQYVRGVMATIPAQQRVLITAHDAFAYFGRAYGVRVEGIQGINTESEVALRRVNQLIDLIITANIGVIFVESSVNDKNVRSLIEGAAARGHQLQIGGVLYSDAMGPAGSYTGTYIGMIDHNATVIARALGGQVPRRGANGRLSL